MEEAETTETETNSNGGCLLHRSKERRTNGTSTSSTSPSTSMTPDGLLKWTQVPPHLKFNPYIHDGYRPLASSTGCIKSLGYFHNETINILTHGIPVLYITLFSSTMIPWDEINVPILPYTHLASIISPWVGSFTYHTFMNHDAGNSIYKRLLQLDMLGIWVTQSIGALTGVIAATYCLPTYFSVLVVLIYGVTCVLGLYKAVCAGCSGTPWDRRICFFFPVLIRVGLVFMRTIGYASGHPDSVAYVWLQDGVAIFGGIIGALRIPEKWFPGRFDFWFNSHHIMHVLVLVAVVHMHNAAKLDMIWLTNPQCPYISSPDATVDVDGTSGHQL